MLCARTDNHQGTGNVVTSAHMTRANDDDAGAAGIGAVAHMTTVDDNYTGHVERGKAARRFLPGATILKASVGPMDNNAYLVTCSATGETLLIDAANDAEVLIDLVRRYAPKLALIVTSHQHFDHWQALQAAAAATEAIAEGFTHVNLDLIYGTPGESDDDLVRSVDAAVQAGVDHVSAYALVVEHGTALARRVRRGELAAPDDDVLAHRYELVDARLSAAGFAWYEVSNWCRPGGECRHNLGYWDGGQWWGAGPGAHGYIGVTRWWNVKHPNTYAEILAGATLPVAGFEQLGADALHTEDVLLKVRLRQGLPLARLGAAERERAEAVLADGLLDYHGDRLVLTGRGRLLADAVVRTLLG